MGALLTGVFNTWHMGGTGIVDYVNNTIADTAISGRLDAIDTAKTLEALNIPGFDFHPLHGKPKRYSIHVNGPWCITFEWEGEMRFASNPACGTGGAQRYFS